MVLVLVAGLQQLVLEVKFQAQTQLVMESLVILLQQGLLLMLCLDNQQEQPQSSNDLDYNTGVQGLPYTEWLQSGRSYYQRHP